MHIAVEEPIHVDAENVAELLQHTDRQLGMITLDLAEIADRDAGPFRELREGYFLDLPQFPDQASDCGAGVELGLRFSCDPLVRRAYGSHGHRCSSASLRSFAAMIHGWFL